MSRSPNQFLHRRSYRQRRMADAARMLPVAGIILLLIPLLLSQSPDASGVRTSAVAFYLFGIWAGLIVVAFGLARVLRQPPKPGGAAAPRDEEGEV